MVSDEFTPVLKKLRVAAEAFDKMPIKAKVV